MTQAFYAVRKCANAQTDGGLSPRPFEYIATADFVSRFTNFMANGKTKRTIRVMTRDDLKLAEGNLKTSVAIGEQVMVLNDYLSDKTGIEVMHFRAWMDANAKNVLGQNHFCCLSRRKIAPNRQLRLLTTWKKTDEGIIGLVKEEQNGERTQHENADCDGLEDISLNTLTKMRINSPKANSDRYDGMATSCSGQRVKKRMKRNSEDAMNGTDEMQVVKERTRQERNSPPSDDTPTSGYRRSGSTRGYCGEKQRELINENLNNKSTEKAMKRIH